jgi:pilus assembly protein Flp/PilA
MIDLRKAWPSLGEMLHRFAADTRGATAIEYAMIAAGIGAAIAAVVTSLGSSVKSNFQKVDNAF